MDPDHPAGPADRSLWWFRIGIICLILGICFYRASETIADPDLWGHVLFGRDVLRARAIPTTDRYSYLTEGYPYREWEWLSKAAIAWFFDVGGDAGLILFKTALSLAILGVLYRRLCASGLDAVRAGMVILVVLFLLLPGITSVRVHLFTYLCFFLFLLLLDAAERGRRGWRWLIPPLFAAWANLHPGVLAGLAVLAVWCGIHVAVLAAETRKASVVLRWPAAGYVLLFLVSALATLLNPFGIHLLVLMAVNVPAPRPEITEFAPVRIATLTGAAYLLLLAACVVGLLYSRRPRRPALVGVFACMALVPLLAVRHTPLFALAAAVLAGEHLADVWRRWSPDEAEGNRRSRPRAAITAVCFAVAAALIVLGVTHCRCVRLEPQQQFPARAVALMKDSGAHGNLAVFFDWGDYALWYLSPRVRVSVDGRRESTYSEEIYAENMTFLYGVGDWSELIDRHPTDLVLVSKQFPVFNLMKLKPGWALVYEDSLCGVFVPENSPQVKAIRGTSVRSEVPVNGVGLCFPGPE